MSDSVSDIDQYSSEMEHEEQEGMDSNTTDSNTQKRILRKDYRKLIKSTEEHSKDIVNNEGDEWENSIRTANSLYSRVTSANDATLDAKFLVLSAELGAKRVKSMKSNRFSMKEFLKNVIRFCRVEENNPNAAHLDAETSIDLGKLGNVFSAHINAAPRACFIVGPLNVREDETLKKTRKITRKTLDIGEEEKPIAVKNNEIRKEENETTLNIARVYELLVALKSAPYWKFVINPNSFSQTVENIFYCAFLAKDNRVKIELIDVDGNEFPDGYITPVDSSQLDRQDSSHNSSNQNMVSITMEGWRHFIEKYSITESLIPTRPPAKGLQNGSKWYG